MTTRLLSHRCRRICGTSNPKGPTMPVSRRLRFEIFTRDDHTCRYCGAKAPDVKLHVDHVIPTTLGGSDDPTNLVTACETCNSGKSSVPPGSPLVEQVAADAVRWAAAMAEAAQRQIADVAAFDDLVDRFVTAWYSWTYKSPEGWSLPMDVPMDVDQSLKTMVAAGATDDDLFRLIPVAMKAPGVRIENRFTYWCGCVWSVLRERTELARQILDEEGP